MFETSTTSAFGLVLTTPQKPHIPIASYSLSEWLAGGLTPRGQRRSHAPNPTLAAVFYVGWRTKRGGPNPKLFGTTIIARLMIRSSAVFGNSSLKSYQTLRNDERDTRRRRPIAGSCRTMYSLSSPHTTE